MTLPPLHPVLSPTFQNPIQHPFYVLRAWFVFQLVSKVQVLYDSITAVLVPVSYLSPPHSLTGTPLETTVLFCMSQAAVTQ